VQYDTLYVGLEAKLCLSTRVICCLGDCLGVDAARYWKYAGAVLDVIPCLGECAIAFEFHPSNLTLTPQWVLFS
jgi:hypothetical protein